MKKKDRLDSSRNQVYRKLIYISGINPKTPHLKHFVENIEII